MKAIAIHRDDDVPRVVDISTPEPEDGEALVRTLRVGIDGTDHNVIGGGHGGFPPGEDYHVLGHEAVGVVEDANDTDLTRGDFVVPTVRRPPEGVESNRYFDDGEPDMAPGDSYVERGIVGDHGYMAEYFTSPAEFLVPIPESLAPYGFLIEPISNSEKAFELLDASRSTFNWQPESAIVLGNGPLGLLTLAMLDQDPRFERLYCLGRRDRPDPTIDIIERLGATYVDSREIPVDDIAEEVEPMDFVYEATGYAPHAFECIDALAPNGVATLLGIPDDWEMEIDGGHLHATMVLENKALLGSVNSNVRHFEAAISSLESMPEWLIDSLITGVFEPTAVESAFEDSSSVIKSAIEFDRI